MGDCITCRYAKRDEHGRFLSMCDGKGNCDYQLYMEYPVMCDGLIEALWDRLGDIPMDPVTERIEQSYAFWEAGTTREDIWCWFDVHHSKGVYYLLYERV